MNEGNLVSRAGQKLDHAMRIFEIDATGLICADLGSNVGGFVDCLLRRGAAKVYSIDTGYGVLAWTLRKDPRVVVMERTNAMHVTLPERVSLVTIDVAWTRQKNILPAAKSLLAAGGQIVTLVKPHYEAERRMLRNGVLPVSAVAEVVEKALQDARAAGLEVMATVESPIKGSKGNVEVLALLKSAGPEGC